MFYTDELLQKIHKHELIILQEIIRICEKNGIQYFTYAGTTLGAVRHGGFIPWDDDIDIGMMRDDYERFIQCCQSDLDERFVLEHFVTNPYTLTYYAKICLKDTIFLESYLKNTKMNHGFFIDVFPFDYISSEEKEQKKIKKRMDTFDQLFRAKVIWLSAKTKKNLRYYTETLVRSLLHIVLLPFPRKLFYGLMENTIRKGSNASDTEYISSRGFCVCKYSDVFPLVQRSFEGITVNVPNNCDAVLKKLYGDYMKLPPVEDRIGHAPEYISFGDNESIVRKMN